MTAAFGYAINVSHINSAPHTLVAVGHMIQLGHTHSKRISRRVAVGHAIQLSHIHSKRISALISFILCKVAMFGLRCPKRE